MKGIIEHVSEDFQKLLQCTLHNTKVVNCSLPSMNGIGSSMDQIGVRLIWFGCHIFSYLLGEVSIRWKNL